MMMTYNDGRPATSKSLSSYTASSGAPLLKIPTPVRSTERNSSSPILSDLPPCQDCVEREREREVYSFSQISTSVSRATITTGTHDNEGYLDRNSNPDTTSLLPIIHSFDLSSARSRENPKLHKTTWEKASPQALRPPPPPLLARPR